MAYSFNGCGTMFYGQRDFRADGTYITTEWITAIYLPLIPLRSFRVRYRGPAERKVPIGFGSAESDAVLESTRPNGKQVLSVYAMIVFYISWLCLVIQVGSQLYPNGLEDQSIGFIALAVAVLGPPAIPLILRRSARKKAGLICNRRKKLSTKSEIQAASPPAKPVSLLPPDTKVRTLASPTPEGVLPRKTRPVNWAFVFLGVGAVAAILFFALRAPKYISTDPNAGTEAKDQIQFTLDKERSISRVCPTKGRLVRQRLLAALSHRLSFCPCKMHAVSQFR